MSSAHHTDAAHANFVEPDTIGGSFVIIHTQFSPGSDVVQRLDAGDFLCHLLQGLGDAVLKAVANIASGDCATSLNLSIEIEKGRQTLLVLGKPIDRLFLFRRELMNIANRGAEAVVKFTVAGGELRPKFL